ncbi:NAD(P)-dependent oxidoreductase [Pseudomonas sp. UL073]|uniref:NAD(P)-dependent oxidoreductase n=1 Tax=Zestomonas insulae TaxID=2809017 RepID=A0ABS2I8V7_9GAMM|nr:NAD(P)-dependent oxidoreductase [Pseudomonas insulae]
MSRFTVLGAGGFVGAHLVEHLRRQGHEVYAPDRHDDSWLEQDLGLVCYCIGLTNDYYARPFATVEAHVSLLARLLQQGRFQRLVYLSSTRLYDSLLAAVGEEAASLQLDPVSPRHLYDLSKALGENLCLTQAGGRACVARLSCVYSDTLEEGGFLAQVLPPAAAGQDLTLDSSPHFARDYVHIEDVVSLLQALLQGAEPAIYNLAAGSNTSNGELFAALQALTGVHVSCTRQECQPAPRISIDKAAQAFGFQPKSLLERLPIILETLKARHHGA